MGLLKRHADFIKINFVVLVILTAPSIADLFFPIPA
ncbi:hypothetical protein VPHD81_0087 [Vibrio phage D81]